MLNEKKNIMTSYFYNDTHFHKNLLTYYEHPSFPLSEYQNSIQIFTIYKNDIIR